MEQGFREAILSVARLEAHVPVYRDVMGWRVQPLPDGDQNHWRAWHVPEACSRIEQVMLWPDGDSRGALRLVKFHGVDPEVMRTSQHTWDTGGIFDLDVYVRDCRALYRRLQMYGWDGFGEPTDYSWGGFDVCEVVARAPDGICLGLLQPYGKVLIDLPEYRAMSRAFNSAQIVRDYDASMQFYVDVLGWKILVEAEVSDAEEPGRNVLGLPRPWAGTIRRRVAIIHPAGTNDGSVEVISMPEIEGHRFDTRCVAPNLGLLALRFPVPDAEAYARVLEGRGVALYSSPVRCRIEPYGACQTFSVRSPDGAILQFFSEG